MTLLAIDVVVVLELKVGKTIPLFQLNYKEKVYPNGVDVYETFNAGGVVKLLLLNADTGKWVEVWSVAKPQVLTQSRIFSIPFAVRIQSGESELSAVIVISSL